MHKNGMEHLLYWLSASRGRPSLGKKDINGYLENSMYFFKCGTHLMFAESKTIAFAFHDFIAAMIRSHRWFTFDFTLHQKRKYIKCICHTIHINKMAPFLICNGNENLKQWRSIGTPMENWRVIS